MLTFLIDMLFSCLHTEYWTHHFYSFMVYVNSAAQNGWKCVIVSDQLMVREYNGYEAWRPEPGVNVAPGLRVANNQAPSPTALNHPDGLVIIIIILQCDMSMILLALVSLPKGKLTSILSLPDFFFVLI